MLLCNSLWYQTPSFLSAQHWKFQRSRVSFICCKRTFRSTSFHLKVFFTNNKNMKSKIWFCFSLFSPTGVCSFLSFSLSTRLTLPPLMLLDTHFLAFKRVFPSVFFVIFIIVNPHTHTHTHTHTLFLSCLCTTFIYPTSRATLTWFSLRPGSLYAGFPYRTIHWEHFAHPIRPSDNVGHHTNATLRV